MASDGDLTVALLPHAARNDRLLRSIRMFDTPELVGHLVVECLVHPGEERDRCWPGQSAFPMHLVDRPLNDDMGAGFKGEWSRLGLKLGPREGAFDVARARVVPLDQIRVVAVHHSDQICQFGCAVRVETLAEVRRLPLDLDRQVREAGRYVLLEEAWFNPAGCL
jgi:hypothetical protein